MWTPKCLDLLTRETQQLRPQYCWKSSLIQSFWSDFQIVSIPAGTATSHTPPPALPWSLIRIQKASLQGFLSLARPLSCILTSSAVAHCRSDKDTKCKQEMNSIIFYFLINLSSWQVQQKTVKIIRGQNHLSDIQNRKKSSLRQMLELVSRSFNTSINAWLPAEVSSLNNKT